VYDLLGQEIETLVNERFPAGEFETTWNATDHPSGVYFYRLEADGFAEARKLIVLK
jgi:hypothetical protein